MKIIFKENNKLSLGLTQRNVVSNLSQIFNTYPPLPRDVLNFVFFVFLDFFIGADFGRNWVRRRGEARLVYFHFIFQKTWAEPGNPS